MTDYPSAEKALLALSPVQYPNGAVVGGRIRRSRNVFALAGQLAADTFSCVPLPAGCIIKSIKLTTDTSLGSTTVAVGNATTANKYAAAAALTATDTPTEKFGKASTLDDDPFTAAETILLTLAAATAPGSGILICDIEYSMP